jgi:hypothetical protein
MKYIYLIINTLTLFLLVLFLGKCYIIPQKNKKLSKNNDIYFDVPDTNQKDTFTYSASINADSLFRLSIETRMQYDTNTLKKYLPSNTLIFNQNLIFSENNKIILRTKLPIHEPLQLEKNNINLPKYAISDISKDITNGQNTYTLYVWDFSNASIEMYFTYNIYGECLYYTKCRKDICDTIIIVRKPNYGTYTNGSMTQIFPPPPY